LANVREPKITQSDLNRAIALTRALGLRVAEVEVTPTRVRLTTELGRELTEAALRENLDAELSEHRARHGHGPP
jgi:hypothetical protein